MTKKKALLWIVVAYTAAIAAATLYLFYAGEGNYLWHAFIADTIATLVIFVFSRSFKNSSFYDAYWSVIPPLLLLYWFYSAGDISNNLRYYLITIPLWFWAIRLTFNWAKHWQGIHHEDWRYPMVRDRFPKLEFFSDFFGTHYFPTVMVFIAMMPVYASLHLATREVNALDYLAFIVGMSAGIIQLISDHQLHKFIATRKPGEIMQQGLWAYSRHPNYFGEISIWASMALFGLAAYPEGWWWQIIGFVAMTLMFVTVSIPFMEKRSLERRPNYQSVIDSTSMLIPLPKKRQK